MTLGKQTLGIPNIKRWPSLTLRVCREGLLRTRKQCLKVFCSRFTKEDLSIQINVKQKQTLKLLHYNHFLTPIANKCVTFINGVLS